MKKLLVVITLAVGLIFSAGCGAKHHTIHMKSGETMTAVGQPEYRADANVYIYVNVNGQRVAIQKDDVEKIVENLN